MNTLSYKTRSIKGTEVERKWHIIDANAQVLGRMATTVANVLRGKGKALFTPHVDCGDYVIIINAEKILLTGKKMDDKQYISHTGYPGGQRVKTPKQLIAKKPEWIIENAVKGMLPKNRLSAQIIKKLHVYAGDQHPHEAQKPETINL